MMQNAPQRRWLIGILLTLIALTGLLSGALTRALLARSATVSPIGQATREGGTVTPPAPSATGTAGGVTSTPPAHTHFTLALSVTPAQVAPGGDLTITVTATADATQGPLPGLLCQLRAPTNGATPLLATWPAGATTDANGVVTWTVQAPAQPGSYGVEAFAKTPDWLYFQRTQVTVR